MERRRPTKGIPQRSEILEPSIKVSTAQAGVGQKKKRINAIRMVKRELAELNTNYLLTCETCLYTEVALQREKSNAGMGKERPGDEGALLVLKKKTQTWN